MVYKKCLKAVWRYVKQSKIAALYRGLYFVLLVIMTHMGWSFKGNGMLATQAAG